MNKIPNNVKIENSSFMKKDGYKPYIKSNNKLKNRDRRGKPRGDWDEDEPNIIVNEENIVNKSTEENITKEEYIYTLINDENIKSEK